MRKTFVAALAASMLFAMTASAWATHNVSLTLSSSTVAAGGSPVTVTAVADGSTEGKVHIDVCQVREGGSFTAVYEESANCQDATVSGDGPRWNDSVVQGDVAVGTARTITHSFSNTATPGKVGFRARYRPQNHAGFSTKTADLTITASTAHAGCKGIENAYAQVTAKGTGKGKAAESLEKVAAKWGGCDLPTLEE